MNRINLKELERIININFINKENLILSLTHKSHNSKINNERLEFLGDSVLDIVISRELMREFPDGDEGLLTQRRAALVQKPFLANMGRLLNLMDYLKIEKNIHFVKIHDCFSNMFGFKNRDETQRDFVDFRAQLNLIGISRKFVENHNNSIDFDNNCQRNLKNAKNNSGISKNHLFRMKFQSTP